MGTRTNYNGCKNRWQFLFVLFIAGITGLSTPVLKAQDYLNPCFYCHMDVLVEMKAKAPKHWQAGVDCEACHGPSEEHVDVEDNSILPNMVWTKKDVHNLCSRCHNSKFLSFEKSAHTKWLNTEEKDTLKTVINCANCHGYHGLKKGKEIQNMCLKCHTVLPETCLIDTSKKAFSISPMTCKKCHDSHSLKLLKSSDLD